MPSLSAKPHQTCSVSVATAFCLSFFRAKTVRMLCSRSASLMTSTSGSETMDRMKVRSCSSSFLLKSRPRLCPDCRRGFIQHHGCTRGKLLPCSNTRMLLLRISYQTTPCKSHVTRASCPDTTQELLNGVKLCVVALLLVITTHTALSCVSCSVHLRRVSRATPRCCHTLMMPTKQAAAL